MNSIIFISPNTNVEYTWRVSGFQAGKVFKVEEQFMLASGKGVNAARAAQTLGSDVLCMGITAGYNGQLFTSMLESEGIKGNFTWLGKGKEGRIAASIYDPLSEKQEATVINGLGPLVEDGDWEKFESDILGEMNGKFAAAFSGSLPPGSPLQAYTDTIEKIQARGTPVWVDCADDALRAALAGHPAGVKVNGAEAGRVTGIEVDGIETAFRAVKFLQQQGAAKVIITLGKLGAVGCDGSQYWQVNSPLVVKPVSAVGSGDAFLGGLLAALAAGGSFAVGLRSASAAGAANLLMAGGGRFLREDYEKLLEDVSVHPVFQP